MTISPYPSRIRPLAARRSGFTLIELLIVVAIIAILAAIAVPNFIEAQARAKISRTVNDLRSMRTAVESYAVDHSKYPRHTWGCLYNDRYEVNGDYLYSTLVGSPAVLRPNGDAGYSNAAEGIGGSVTTPIQYLSSLPKDPFIIPGYTGPDFGQGGDMYTYHNVETWISIFRSNPQPLCDSSVQGYYWGFPNIAQINSIRDTIGEYILLGVGPKASAGGYEDSRRTNSASFFVQYDPTNGTISLGSVFVSHKYFEPSYVPEQQLRWWMPGEIPE